MKRIIIVISSFIYISGCAWVLDSPKTLWGSSIRVLSDQRASAETQTFSCSKEKCFDVVENFSNNTSHGRDNKLTTIMIIVLMGFFLMSCIR